MRRYQDGRLVHLQEDAYDLLLLQSCAEAWNTAAQIVARAMQRCDAPNRMTDLFFSNRLRHLIDAGLVEAEGERQALATYRSEYYTSIFNQQPLAQTPITGDPELDAVAAGFTDIQEGYWNANLGAGWEPDDANWRIEAYVTNVLDETATQKTLLAPNLNLRFLNAPRTGAPFLNAMISDRYSSADLSWSLASMVDARYGPSKLPFAWLVFALAIDVRTSSSDRPYAASAFGLTWIRTAGRWPPLMLTRPTPGSCEIFCATRVSAMSCSFVSGSVFEESARVRIGVSAGLTLL